MDASAKNTIRDEGNGLQKEGGDGMHITKAGDFTSRAWECLPVTRLGNTPGRGKIPFLAGRRKNVGGMEQKSVTPRKGCLKIQQPRNVNMPKKDSEHGPRDRQVFRILTLLQALKKKRG